MPDRVDPKLILGVCVSCEIAKQGVEVTGLPLDVRVDPHLFFMD